MESDASRGSKRAEVVQLAKQLSPATGSELGVTNTPSLNLNLNNEALNPLLEKVTYKMLKQLTEKDGEARALLRLITMPIRSAKWMILTQDEDDLVKKKKATVASVVQSASRERDFINEVLFTSIAEGGMTVPFASVISNMTLAVRDGFKVYEKVFDVNDRGFIVLRKLGIRENETITLLGDDHGDFAGFRQYTYFKGKLVDVTIAKDKALLFVIGKEENSLYGDPLFLPVYYHYDKKHKLYYISHIAFQKLAIPDKVGKVPPGTDPKITDKFRANLASMALNAVTTCPTTFEVDAIESARNLADFMPLIEHHDKAMAKAILAQFIELATSATGKLSAEQSDLFVLGLVSIIDEIEDTFNNWVIPQLIDFNFGTKKYPKLRARPFTDKDQEIIREVFMKVVTAAAKITTPEFNLAIEKKMAGQLDLNELDYTKITADAIKVEKDLRNKAANPVSGLAGQQTGGNAGGRPQGKKGGASEKGNG